MRTRPLVLLAAALLLLLCPSAALAQFQNRYLNAAMRLYGDLEYESALESLKKAAAQADNNPAEDVQIALYMGLIHFELGDAGAAESAFKKALAYDENLALPRNVSPKAVAAFEKARREILKARPPKPVVGGDAPRADRTIVAVPRPLDAGGGAAPAAGVSQRSGSRTSLALGIGLPLVAAGVGLIGGGAYFGSQMKANVDHANDPVLGHYQDDYDAYLAQARKDARNANVMFGVGAAVAVAGAVTLIAILATSGGASAPAGEPLPH